MVSSVLDRVHTVLAIILVSILFSYLIYPAVKWLAQRMSRGLAIVTVYAGFVIMLVLAGAYLAPAVARQSAELAHSYPKMVGTLQHEMANPGGSVLLQRLPAQVRDVVANNAAKAGSYIGLAASVIGKDMLAFISGTVQAVAATLVILILAYFFITDLDRIQSGFLRVVPARRKAGTISFVAEADRVIGGFIRGQVLLALIVGTACTIVLFATGVRFALLLGLLTGVASIIPYVGAVVGLVPAFLVALFTIGFARALIVAALFILVFELQGHLLTPIIVARSVGVTPLVVFIALLVGVEAYGILGMLLAVPVVGIIRVAMDRLFPRDAESERLLRQARVISGEPKSAA
jgi:predicted PurR-regulated permease PerM